MPKLDRQLIEQSELFGPNDNPVFYMNQRHDGSWTWPLSEASCKQLVEQHGITFKRVAVPFVEGGSR